MRTSKRNDPLYARIREILESARSNVARSVNTTQVIANWLVGREIVEGEQGGQSRAGYGERLMRKLAEKIERDFGAGYGLVNLKLFKQFFLSYPHLLKQPKGYAARNSLASADVPGDGKTGYAVRSLSESGATNAIERASRDELNATRISDESRRKSWKPGFLHPNLSWTHYRTLLRVDNPAARSFYEIEAIKDAWSAREVERQINSLLYERLALSKNKKGLMRLATKGQELQSPMDVFKDPVVIEFLGMPASRKLVESNLEQALIDNLQTFLLELGRGFALAARQQRITLDGDHFYIDLVFYHTVLKCYILLDLKIGKLTHQDLGQLQLYVNYYDRERLTPGDNPTLGLILCTDKNDAVVKYTLGRDQADKIFTSRYKLHVPSVTQLKAEIRRELKVLQGEKRTP